MTRRRNVSYNNRVIMRTIKRMYVEMGRPPTIIEVAARLGAGKTSVYEGVRELRALELLPQDHWLIPSDIKISFDKEDY